MGSHQSLFGEKTAQWLLRRRKYRWVNSGVFVRGKRYPEGCLCNSTNNFLICFSVFVCFSSLHEYTLIIIMVPWSPQSQQMHIYLEKTVRSFHFIAFFLLTGQAPWRLHSDPLIQNYRQHWMCNVWHDRYDETSDTVHGLNSMLTHMSNCHVFLMHLEVDKSFILWGGNIYC